MSDLYNEIYKKTNTVSEYDVFKKFMITEDPYIGGIPFIFITTPFLNLDENYKKDNYFIDMKNNMPKIYNSLSMDLCKKPFITLCSNYFMGINGKDLAARTIDVGETMYGYKQTLPGPLVDSKIADTVSVKYHETKFLPLIKLHKLWMEYVENATLGLFYPSKTIIDKDQIDYLSTIYYFVLDRDLSTILYYCRYTGVAPVSNPFSTLVSNIGDNSEVKEIEIEYSYSYKEDLDPSILLDFNKVTTGKIAMTDKGVIAADTVPETGERSYEIFKSSTFKRVYVAQSNAFNDGTDITPIKKYMLRFIN